MFIEMYYHFLPGKNFIGKPFQCDMKITLWYVNLFARSILRADFNHGAVLPSFIKARMSILSTKYCSRNPIAGAAEVMIAKIILPVKVFSMCQYSLSVMVSPI